MSAVLREVGFIAARSVRRTFRQSALLVPVRFGLVGWFLAYLIAMSPPRPKAAP